MCCKNNENYTGIIGIWAHDAAMTERLGPIVDCSLERLGKSDTAITKMHRLLIDCTRASERGEEPVVARDGFLYRVRSYSVVINSEEEFDARSDIMDAMQVDTSGPHVEE